jgi:hypothetical protein
MRLVRDEPEQDTADTVEPGTWRRLFIAFMLIVGLALAFYYLLPGVWLAIPWYVPVLAFGVIVLSTLLRMFAGAKEIEVDLPPETPGEHPLRSDLERFG